MKHPTTPTERGRSADHPAPTRAPRRSPRPAGRPTPTPDGRGDAAPPLLPAQKVSVAVFGLIDLVLLALIATGQPESLLRWLKTPPIALLFVAALLARPRTRAKRLITVGLALSALGDAFLVGFVPLEASLGPLAGMGAFALAYVVLTVAFWDGRPRPPRLWPAVVFACVGVAMCAAVWPYLSGVMTVAVPAFAVIISTMAATACSTPHWRRFPARVAIWMAVAAVLLVGNDALVALQLFHPAFNPAPVASEFTIRGTYLLGWLLLLLAVQDRQEPPSRRRSPRGRPAATLGR